MSNLLPENSRTELRQEYRARYVFAGSLLAIGAAVFMSLSMLPSYVAFSSSLPKGQNTTASDETKKDFADITRAQSLVQQLAPTMVSTSTISRAIQSALAVRSRGAHVDNISYMRDPLASGVVTIGGLADGRVSINEYRTALQKVPSFTSVRLPVGDLIGSQGGRFTVTLTGNF